MANETKRAGPIPTTISMAISVAVGVIVAVAALAAAGVFTPGGGPTPTKYRVTFAESGISSGQPAVPVNWSFTFNGVTVHATEAVWTLWEPNGSYPFWVEPVAGFDCSPPAGTVVVAGSNQTVPVVFTLIPPYVVGFTQNGIAQSEFGTGPTWSVTLNGVTESSPGATIQFVQYNGNYTYFVSPISGYTANPSSGVIRVDGGPVYRLITFSPN